MVMISVGWYENHLRYRYQAFGAFLTSLLVLFVVLCCPVSVLSHPGGTDKRGGHKCWKDCGGWRLESGEYHLHDKDWNPIKLDADGKPAEPAAAAPKTKESKPPEAPEQAAPPVNLTEPKTEEKAVLPQKGAVVAEKDELPCNPIYPILIVLLFLLLVRYMKKPS